MKKVIINADDFGYSAAVNEGIITTFKNGVLSSTTLMANMPGCDEAIELSRKNPNLGIGGHLVLTCGSPMTDVPSLVDKNGEFYKLDQYEKNRTIMNANEIFNEWCYQIDYLLDSGVNLTHLDSHHHVHTFEENLEVTKNIAEKYHLTFRNSFNLEKKIQLPCQKGIKGFHDLMNYPNIRDMEMSYENNKEACLGEIQKVLEKLEQGEISELMVHPAFVDESLYFNSSFNVQRIKEVEILCDPILKETLSQNGIEVVNYGDIKQ